MATRCNAGRSTGLRQRGSGSIGRRIGRERDARRGLARLTHQGIPSNQWGRNHKSLIRKNGSGGNTVAMPAGVRIQGIALPTGAIITDDGEITHGGCGNGETSSVLGKHAVDLHGGKQDQNNPGDDQRVAAKQAQQGCPRMAHGVVLNRRPTASYLTDQSLVKERRR